MNNEQYLKIISKLILLKKTLCLNNSVPEVITAALGGFYLRLGNSLYFGSEWQFDAKFHSEIKNRNRFKVFRRSNELICFKLAQMSLIFRN